MTAYSRIVHFDAAGNRLVAGAAGDKWSADALALSSAPNNGLSATAGELFASKLTGATFDPVLAISLCQCPPARLLLSPWHRWPLTSSSTAPLSIH